MIDKVTILVPHALMLVALWRLLKRPDLDRDPAIGEAARAMPAPRARARTNAD